VIDVVSITSTKETVTMTTPKTATKRAISPKARKVETPTVPAVEAADVNAARLKVVDTTIGEYTSKKEAYGARVFYSSVTYRRALAHGVTDIKAFMAKKPDVGSNLLPLYTEFKINDEALRSALKAGGMKSDTVHKAMFDIRKYVSEFQSGVRPMMINVTGEDFDTSGKRGTNTKKTLNARVLAKIEELAKMLVNGDVDELDAKLRKVRNPVCDLYRVVTGKDASTLVKVAK
jgi:hypothetical protein